jgi:hypothetical protein
MTNESTGNKQELCMNTTSVKLIREALSEYADDNGWAELGLCGGLIKRQQPDFDPRAYEYDKLSSLMATTNLFELDCREFSNNMMNQKYIKDKRA